ncbi:lipopolysaccharide biosynthesis protein [Roseibacillus persicicus]|uniref:lipopolysaccharide biosynthesis protein n=1 Tax=Roseibacillus persicicus TaxID=454148 RepID=UPI00398BB748
MNETNPEQNEAGSQRRNRAITSAIATSLASKIGTVVLQFVSIPIAYRTLGEETFGLYATIAVSIGTVILFQIGIGPALTHGISRALTAKDDRLEKQYFSTSWFLLLILTLIGGLVAGLVLTFVPLTFFFGEHYAGLEPKLLPGLWLALGIVLLEIILSHTERAREGFLQVHINNTFGAAGNILGAITIAIGIHYFQTIEFLIIAIFGTRALARIANTIHLFLQRPDLAPKLQYFEKPLSREMLSDGFAFTVSQSLTGIIEINGCGLLVARFGGPVAVGQFQILMQLSGLMLGMIIMFTTPTWPAIVDAFTRRDFDWVKRVTKRLWLLVGGYCGAALIGLPLVGTFILPLIFGKEFQVTPALLFAFGLYFATSSWGHTNNALLIGVGLVKKAAVYSLAETSIILIPAAIGICFFGLSGLFVGMALAMIAITGWIFPLMLINRIRTESLTPAIV